MRTLRVASVAAAALLARVALGADDTPPLETVVTGRADGVDQVVLAQRATGDSLTLSPDTCFFAGALDGLTLAGHGTTPDPLNGGASFARIDGLSDPDQRVVWPLWLHADGTVEGKVAFTGTGRLNVTLASEKCAVVAGTFKFANVKQGRADLVVSADAFKGSIQSVSLSGTAIDGAQLLRARWRPAAVHCGLRSSTLGDKPADLWVVEVRPVPGEQGFYAPVTTPFGYFGSTFRPDGVIGGVNFSMWSFARAAAEPPVAHLSHLLAVGSPQATFGGFDSEGTGVKLRGWNPFDGRHVRSETLALRFEPGTPYDTYAGYFWEPGTAAWHLYAVGRKWSPAKSVQSLLPGFFIEVPGPAAVQRTGQTVRAADVRGWCRDTAGRWHPLDTMDGGRRDARRGDAVNCTWTASPDGWLRASMGGMTHYRYAEPVVVHGVVAQNPPDYMAPEKLAALNSLPSDVRIDRATRTGHTLTLDVHLATTATGPTRITALYGSSDALSFVDRWEHTRDLGVVDPGTRTIALTDVPATGFVRLRAENDTGTYVSPDPGTW